MELLPEHWNQPPALWLLIAAGLTLLIQLGYYCLLFIRLALYKSDAEPEFEDWPAVSVVICARNEEENLKKYLPLVLGQHYPAFEVVVVNDCSWDGSADWLKEMAEQHPHLRIAEIKEVEGREHGKKFALSIGIKAAKHEILLLTDADCAPSSEHWIMHMLAAYGQETEIVLGYGKTLKTGGLLNTIIRFDTFFIAIQYLSMALARSTYMGVGRNLSYKRQLFFNNKGFATHMHLLSGDDDLFINEVANERNVRVVVHPEAHTLSPGKTTWRSWFRQKKRHHTTAVYYRTAHKLALAWYPLSYYLFHAVVLVGLVMQQAMLILIFMCLLRALVQIAILQACGRKLKEEALAWAAPLLEFFHRVLVYPLYVLNTITIRKNKWS